MHLQTAKSAFHLYTLLVMEMAKAEPMLDPFPLTNAVN